MANAFPLLLIAGGAALMLSGKKRRRTSAKKTADEAVPDVSAPTTNGAETTPDPEPADEDMDKPEDEQVGTGQVPPPTPTPVPEPTPAEHGVEFEPGDPYGKPALGPSGAGNCANSIYNRDPGYISPDLVVSQKAMAMFPEAEMFFYLRPDAQALIYNYMFEKFTKMRQEQERRTVASVVLRDALKSVNAECEWENSIDTLGAPEQLVWDSARRLALMAQVTAGIEDPTPQQLFVTGNRFAVSRDSLGDPDPGFMGASKKPEPGRRVEILVTDESMANAEHIIGKIEKLSGPNGEPDLFEVRIIGTFQGNNVAPTLRDKHGFKTGSNAYFSQNGPTGIYRIFPSGTE